MDNTTAFKLSRATKAQMSKSTTFAAMISDALSESAMYGNSVPFWIRTNDPKHAGRLARLAARRALKVIGR